MKYFLLLLLLVCGCSTPRACDEKVHELYPTSNIETIDGTEVQTYTIDQEYAVECDWSSEEPEIRPVKWRPWKEAWCAKFNSAFADYPPECKKAEKE